MSVVTRFPPSPTGFMHIGTARTALFNWLYARKHGGKMLFRIEDTDRARHNEEAVDALIKAMEWLELDWDGDIISQYQQRDRHADVARQLVDNGKAYYCYASPEELDAMRESAKAEGRTTFYNRKWRDKGADEAPDGIDPVVRIKAPLEGEVTLNDQIQGDVTLQNKQLDDFIILRSDGSPTYMLSVVVDDHDMGVTHVIRGDDHLNNTFRQNIIYDAMGWDQPIYAHLPLILGPDGAKMSKRHGAAAVEEYRDMGYLPEAVKNYLLRLGWSHGDDEIIPMDKALEWFDLKGCNKAAARFDFDKLENLNAHYIKQTPDQALLNLCKPLYEKINGSPLSPQAETWILAAMEELKNRAKTLHQIVDESLFFTVDTVAPNDEAGEILKGEEAQQVLKDLPDVLSAVETWTSEEIMTACKTYAKGALGGKLGKVGMPLRAKITGRKDSPGIFKLCEILGKEETLHRI